EGRRQEAQPGRRGRGCEAFRRRQALRIGTGQGRKHAGQDGSQAVVDALGLRPAVYGASLPQRRDAMERVLLAFAALSVAGCATSSTAASSSMPADAFLSALEGHCGKAYAGRIVANQPASATPDPFEGKTLVMHVRGCDDPTREIRVPFHVG